MPASVPLILRALAIWLLIVAAESLQGGLRRLLFSSEVDFLVRQVAVVVGAAIIFAITWASMRWLRVRSSASALAIGVPWVTLTLGFAIALGRLMGLSEARLLADYDLLHGGLMPLGLAAMAFTPWAVRHLQARRPSRPA
jgi:hypothetical protein